MNDIAKVYVNISMEGISLIYMAILFIASLSKKNRTKANRLLVCMTAMEILIILCQLIQWALWVTVLNNQQSEFISIYLLVLYAVDFSLMHFEIYTFCMYVFERIGENRLKTPEREKKIRILKLIILVYSIIVCLLFISSGWTGMFYTLDKYGHASYNNGYLLLVHSSNLIALLCVFAIIKNWKTLGNSTSIIMLLFVAAREIILPIDLVSDTSFSYIFLAIEITVLYFGVDLKKDEIMSEQKSQLALQAAELESKNTQIMISQIQPHFLYNTLSVIDYLCEKDSKLARKAVSAFSDYLRMNMETLTSTELVPFEKELEHTKTYLWIEKLRFDDILNVEYDIQTTDFTISPLTLQPLCENAVKHGVRGKEEGGTVKITTRRNGNTVAIIVEDDGIGFDPDIKINDGKTHVGIENVRKRIETMMNGRLEIESKPGEGTVATIVLEVEDESLING